MQLNSLKAKSGAVLLAALFVPAAIILDWIVIDCFCSQQRATHFPQATAKITHSEIQERRGSKGGRSYYLKLAYEYTVDGHRYTGERLRYYAGSFSKRANANHYHATYAVGRSVPAYYDPANPADAILVPGVNGTDWIIALLAVGLTLAAIGMIGLVIAKRTSFDPQDPACLRQTDSGWEARLPHTSRRGVFIFTMAISCGLSAGVFALAYGSKAEPELVGAALAGSAMLAAVSSVAFSRYPKLIADLDAKELSLPAPLFGSASRAAFDAIISVVVRESERTAGRNSTYHVYHCDVNWMANGRYRNQPIATFLDRSEAERLALWLNLNLGKVTVETDN